MGMTLTANLMQAAMIERFAARRGMSLNDAARVWIGAKAKAFRAFWNRRQLAAGKDRA